MSDNVFRLYPKPADASEDTINSYFEIAQEITLSHAKALMADPSLGEVLDNQLFRGGPVLPSSVPELFFHTKKRHGYAFEPVPYGHDMGWACYDPNVFDGDPAEGNTLCGYGKTQDEAYVDYVNSIEDEVPARPGMVVHSSPFEPPTVVDAIYQDPDEEL